MKDIVESCKKKISSIVFISLAIVLVLLTNTKSKAYKATFEALDRLVNIDYDSWRSYLLLKWEKEMKPYQDSIKNRIDTFILDKGIEKDLESNPFYRVSLNYKKSASKGSYFTLVLEKYHTFEKNTKNAQKPMSKKHVHYKLYKPYGVLSQLYSNDSKQNRKKIFLSKLFDFPEGTMPIGRLDEKSEGLLLMTTDGKLSDHINRSGIEKEYYAQLDGTVTPQAVDSLQRGVEIGFFGKRYVTKPCFAALMEAPSLPQPDKRLRLERHRPSSWIRIIITEGKFKQIRKMTAAVGFPTLRLIRIRIGNITLENLKPGNFEPVSVLIS